MNRNIAMQNALLAVTASIVLAACGGGAQTEATPIPPGGGSNNNSPYTGPVARDASVLAFQQEFWANAKTTDRCGSCHNEQVGQLPMFVRNDDINLAYDAAVTVTDTQQPTLSRLDAVDDIEADCDLLDNGSADLSCLQVVDRGTVDLPSAATFVASPPFTLIASPFTYEARSDARKPITSATSLSPPTLPIGLTAMRASHASCAIWSMRAVPISPGQTELAVMPSDASSFAIACVKPSTAKLAAQ